MANNIDLRNIIDLTGDSVREVIDLTRVDHVREVIDLTGDDVIDLTGDDVIDLTGDGDAMILA